MAPSALTFLLLILAGLAALAIWLLLKPGKYTPWERLQYAPVYLMARYLWRVQILQYQPSTQTWEISSNLIADIPELIEHASQNGSDTTAPKRGCCKHQGAVLVANHRSSVDPCFIQLAAGDRVHWMVAGEYFKVPIVGSLLRSFQCIPTNRGGVDTASTKRAIELAKSGRFVGMFPEGRINRTEQAWMTVRPGAALVALRAGVPLVPVWIQGARMGTSVISPFFMPTRVKVYLGEPDSWGLEQLKLEDGRSDRQIADDWIRLALAKSLEKSSGRHEKIQLAGAKWLNEQNSGSISSIDPANDPADESANDSASGPTSKRLP